MGAVSSLIYAKRNIDKTVKGDVGRAPIPVLQTYNAICDTAFNAASNGFTKFGNGASYITNGIDKVAGHAGVSNSIFKVTSKLVNPLLVGAAGIRILKDEDKESRLIEEVSAMGTMFAAESAFKLTRAIAKSGINKGNLNSINADIGALKAVSGGFKNFGVNIASKIFANQKMATFLKTTSDTLSKHPNAKKALFIGAELLAVGISILGYDLGKKIGLNITGRNKKDLTKQEQPIASDAVKNEQEKQNTANAKV